MSNFSLQLGIRLAVNLQSSFNLQQEYVNLILTDQQIGSGSNNPYSSSPDVDFQSAYNWRTSRSFNP